MNLRIVLNKGVAVVCCVPGPCLAIKKPRPWPGLLKLLIGDQPTFITFVCLTLMSEVTFVSLEEFFGFIAQHR